MQHLPSISCKWLFPISVTQTPGLSGLLVQPPLCCSLAVFKVMV